MSERLLADLTEAITDSATWKVGSHARDIFERARSEIIELEQQLAAAQARIPREPTHAMIQLGSAYANGSIRCRNANELCCAIWRAMYDAAQSQEPSK